MIIINKLIYTVIYRIWKGNLFLGERWIQEEEREEQGNQGEQGKQGNQGEQGDQGNQGEHGEQGEQWGQEEQGGGEIQGEGGQSVKLTLKLCGPHLTLL